MDNKIRKGARNKVFGIVLCLSLVLGMSMSMMKMVSAGSNPNSLGVTDAYINTTDRTIVYNASETYVIGTMEMGSEINYVSGTAMNVTFSRAIGNTQGTANADGEWFEFLQGSDFTVDGKDYSVYYLSTIQTTDKITYGMYVDNNRYCKNETIASNLNTPANAVPFVIKLHNIKSDLTINYELINDKISFNNTTDPKELNLFGTTLPNGTTPQINISSTKINIQQATLTFNVKDGSPSDEYTFADVASVSGLVAGKTMPKAQIPAAPTMTDGVDDLNFAGWYTNSTGALSDENKLTESTIITGNKTYYARWTPKEITLSWNTDSLKKSYPLGGESASVSAVTDQKKKCGGQMNFTLTIDGKAYNTENELSAADQAIVDKVTFTFEYAELYKKLEGTKNNAGYTYRVVDIQPGGFAIARYSGVVKVTLNYLGSKYTSSNKALVIVPGDMNGDGVIITADLNIMAGLLRGEISAGAPGSKEEYYGEVADSNCDNTYIVSDIANNAERLRKIPEDSDFVIYNTAFN